MRIKPKNLLTVLVGVSLSIGFSGAAHAALPSYTFTDLGALDGATHSYATGINDSGQVVGYSYTPGNNVLNRAFITGPDGIGMTDLGTLGGPESYATGINDSGQVVGTSFTPGFVSYADATHHAFITGPNGVGMTDLGTLGETRSAATGINASGQVTGISYTTGGGTYSRAFITGPNGVGMTDLGSLGWTGSDATGINASGQVVGFSMTTSNQTHAFITGPNGVGMTDLGTLGGTFSLATGINANGQVVGFSDTANEPDHAFITGPNGVGMTDLGTSGGTGSRAYGINASGQVVGIIFGINNYPNLAFITGPNGVGMTDLNSLASLAEGDYFTQAMGVNDQGQIIARSYLGHAYLLTPVPEPETYAMMLAGLGLVGAATRRRRV